MMSRAAQQFAVGQHHQPTAASASTHTAFWSSASRTTLLRACSGAASGVFRAVVTTPTFVAGQGRGGHRPSGQRQRHVLEIATARPRCEPARAQSVSDNRCSPAASRTTEASRLIARCSSRRFGAVWVIGSGHASRATRPAAAACAAAAFPARPPTTRPSSKLLEAKPVGAVHPGAGHLARGEQPGQLGLAVHVGDDAAAAVVRPRDDRDGLTDGVDACGPARGGDGREPGLEAVDAAGVEVDARIAGGLQPRVDRGRDDVARRQVAHRVNTGRYRIALPVKQYRTLTADGLGDQRPPAAGLARPREKHGRVELDELEIADRDPGPQRQRDSVAGGALGIGGRAVEVPEPAGGQDHRGRADDAASRPG